MRGNGRRPLRLWQRRPRYPGNSFAARLVRELRTSPRSIHSEFAPLRYSGPIIDDQRIRYPEAKPIIACGNPFALSLVPVAKHPNAYFDTVPLFTAHSPQSMKPAEEDGCLAGVQGASAAVSPACSNSICADLPARRASVHDALNVDDLRAPKKKKACALTRSAGF